jgi:hypothetical protein
MANPADFQISPQTLDGKWIGEVKGYLECDDVPIKLEATYKKNEGGTYLVDVGGLYLDKIGVNRGIDYLKDFWYGPRLGLDRGADRGWPHPAQLLSWGEVQVPKGDLKENGHGPIRVPILWV